MAKFKGNYFQHIMDIFINDGYDYKAISEMLDVDDRVIMPESIRRSHNDSTRGNLPSGVTASLFYEGLVCGFYTSEIDRKDFARRLNILLTNDDMFPEEWKDKSDLISGFSDKFDKEVFGSFIQYILNKDKHRGREKDVVDSISSEKSKDTDSKKAKNKIALMSNKELALQRGNAVEETEKETQCEVSPLTFSACFFNKGARGIAHLDPVDFETELERLSEIFKNISTFDFKHKTDNLEEDENMINRLVRIVESSLRTSRNKDVLKVKGPLGSYKNRLMQYLYLAIERKLDFVAPIYLDIASYEKVAEGDDGINENDFLKLFETDIKAAEEIVARTPDKTPLLILDGVRDFACKNESLYYSINERIHNNRWYLIVCMDSDFTINNQNKYGVHPLVSNSYECYLRIRSMNLNRRQESLEFIRNCVEIFSISLPSEVNAESIRDNLVRLNFFTIDAYWLTYVLNSHLNDILNHNSNISGLYNAICLSFLGSHHLVDSAAEFAFEFEFGKRSYGDENPYFDLRWRLIRKHRSVLEFLIAKYYIKKVSELNLETGTRAENIEKLTFFNMVLQKSITRFVVTMLKGVDDYERQIMIIARKYYDELDLFGKSELTFWMARLKNPMRKRQCVEILQSYNKKELPRYNEDKSMSVSERRKLAFLLRGINVSLIYENDKKALEYYLNSLLTDKIANSVNRGFHLEYYGDKPYIPNQSLLDFEDDVTCGESTFTVLCLSLDRCKRRNDATSLSSVLEIMTLCNLIQARLEETDNSDVLDVSPYIDKCIHYLEWIMQARVMRGLKDVFIYFHWMYDELQKYKSKIKSGADKPRYNRADVFNKFTDAASVKRTGWVELNVPEPENIVEHMYNCWLIGAFYLPDTYDEPGYSKRDILDMLMFHDLGEVETGDINRPVKMENKSFYDHQERLVMHGIFLSGTYPSSVNLSRYMNLWNVWDSGVEINYKIAKDIDNIQTIYRFCKYYLQYPQIFSEEDISYWLMGRYEIETDICKDISDVLIVNNPLFKDIIERYNYSENE